MLFFENFKKLNIKGAGELYEDNANNLLYSIFNINNSGIDGNKNFRIQLSSERRDILKKISLKMNKQILILCRLTLENKSVYIYAPTSHFLLRKFEVRSSIWFGDKSAILDSYKNDSIETGSEEGGKLDTICFSEKKFNDAIELIISTLPIIGDFKNREKHNENELENLLRDLRKNEMMKELIGYVGEYIFYKKSDELNFCGKKIKGLLWNYAVGEKFANHDFKIKLSNNENRFVEIKSTSPTSNNHFISKNEINFMENNNENYSLVTIKLNLKFMNFLFGEIEKIKMDEINYLIENNNFEMEIYDGSNEIKNKFNFEGKIYELERR